MNNVIPVVVAVVAIVVASATPPVFAHAKLQASEPENGATVTVPPAAVKLRYNEAVEPAMSKLKFVGPGSAAVQTGRPALAEGDEKTLVVPVSRLPAGDYRVEWSTMGRDGHPMKGEVRFKVK